MEKEIVRGSYCTSNIFRDQNTLINSTSHVIIHTFPVKLNHVLQAYFTDTWATHDDVIKWKHFPRYWPFVRGIHRSLVNSPHKGRWRGALMFLWSSPWINGWVNNCEAGDLKCYRADCDVIVMHTPCHNLSAKDVAQRILFDGSHKFIESSQ